MQQSGSRSTLCRVTERLRVAGSKRAHIAQIYLALGRHIDTEGNGRAPRQMPGASREALSLSLYSSSSCGASLRRFALKYRWLLSYLLCSDWGPLCNPPASHSSSQGSREAAALEASAASPTAMRLLQHRRRRKQHLPMESVPPTGRLESAPTGLNASGHIHRRSRLVPRRAALAGALAPPVLPAPGGRRAPAPPLSRAAVRTSSSS